MATLQVKISDSLKDKLAPRQFERAMKAGALGVAAELQGILQPYPPATAANRPGRWRKTKTGDKPMGYYERNRGYWSPRVNVRRGSFGNFGKAQGRIKATGETQRKTKSVGGYVLTSHSDQLGKKWIVKQSGMGATLTNSARYAAYVQSAKKQSRIMAAIGWKTDQAAINEVKQSGVAAQIYRDAIARYTIKR